MEWRNTCCSVTKEQATLVAVLNCIVVRYGVLRTVPSSRQQFIICIVRDCKFWGTSIAAYSQFLTKKNLHCTFRRKPLSQRVLLLQSCLRQRRLHTKHCLPMTSKNMPRKAELKMKLQISSKTIHWAHQRMSLCSKLSSKTSDHKSLQSCNAVSLHWHTSSLLLQRFWELCSSSRTSITLRKRRKVKQEIRLTTRR